jgi:cobalt-zinc-cadmium efflux system outer membrane protein
MSAVVVWSFVPAGCDKVDAQPDFQRAAAEIEARLDVGDVYDPAADALVAERVQVLIADGLTVDEAVRAALLNNRGFQAMFAALGASRADVVQSGLLSNPTLALGLRFPEGGGRSNLTFGLAQEIVDLWQIPVRRRLAEAELAQVVRQVLHRAVELSAQVRAGAYEAIGLAQAERIAEANVALAERSLSLTESRFRAGELSQLDVNLLRMQVVDAKRARIVVNRDRLIAEARLARLLGLSRNAGSLVLIDELVAPVTIGDDDAVLIELALAERFDVQVADAQVLAAGEELIRQQRSVFRSIGVGFELERVEKRAQAGRKLLADTVRSSARAGALTLPEVQTRRQRRRERSMVIDAILGPTLQLEVPLWDQNQAQIAKARFNLLRAGKEREDLLDAVALDVRTSAARVRAAGALVRFFEDESLPVAEAGESGARQLFDMGEASVLVLIQAQESLIVQRRAHIDALIEYALGLAELERSVGGRLPPAW